MPGTKSPAAGVGEGEPLKSRPRYEVVMRLVHPVTRRLVAGLARTAVQPWQVVVAHSLIGLVAALLITSATAEAWAVAALLLQVKTLLDNADGGLARATGRVTELGRYLDTGLDLIVNLAIFAALAIHGPAWLAVVAFVVLTFVLSYDFNAERLYREARLATAATTVTPPLKTPPSAATSTPSGPTAARSADPLALRLFRGLYRLLLAPQDRLIGLLDARLYRHASGQELSAADAEQRRLWSDLFSTAALVNLGLSSQYVLLGLCLLTGRPFAYVYLVLLQGVYLGLVQYLRVMRFRGRDRQDTTSGGER